MIKISWFIVELHYDVFSIIQANYVSRILAIAINWNITSSRLAPIKERPENSSIVIIPDSLKTEYTFLLFLLFLIIKLSKMAFSSHHDHKDGMSGNVQQGLAKELIKETEDQNSTKFILKESKCNYVVLVHY